MSHKKEVCYWVVRHLDGSYLCTHKGKPWWQWANGHILRNRYAVKEEAVAAREETRVSEKRCSHTARIIKVTVRR